MDTFVVAFEAVVVVVDDVDVVFVVVVGPKTIRPYWQKKAENQFQNYHPTGPHHCIV